MSNECENAKRRVNQSLVDGIRNRLPEAEVGLALQIADDVMMRIAERCQLCREGRESDTEAEPKTAQTSKVEEAL
jgi:hypothetical protein